MKTSIKVGLAFTAGALIGSVVSAIFTKKYIESQYEIVEEDKDTMEEQENVIEEVSEPITDEKPIITSTDQEEYKEMLEKLKYSGKLKPVEEWELYDIQDEEDENYDDINYAPGLNKDNCEDVSEETIGINWDLPINHESIDPDLLRPPYLIDKDEFEEYVEVGSSWTSDSYTHYEDGYITDSYGLPIEPEEVERLFNCIFDEGIDKSQEEIFVRNEILQMDFSIVFEPCKFVDVASPRIRKMVGL